MEFLKTSRSTVLPTHGVILFPFVFACVFSSIQKRETETIIRISLVFASVVSCVKLMKIHATFVTALTLNA